MNAREVNVGVLGLHGTCTEIKARADTQEAEDASKGSNRRANKELSCDFDLFEENIVQSGEVGADCWIRREFYT